MRLKQPGRTPGQLGWKKREQQAASTPAPYFMPVDTNVRLTCQKTMASLQVVAEYFEASGMREVLNDLCPSAGQASISHADAVLALVCNRLTAPRPLYRVEDWAQEFAVEACLGLAPAQLNDDRLAATLDAIADKADAIYGSVAAVTVERFNINTRIVHRDLTDIALHGGYETQDGGFAQVMYGWPGANVPRGCKVVRQDVVTTEDGAIPLMMRTYSGSASDINTVLDVMETLREKSKVRRFIFVGDTKVLSERNLHKILADECDILAPMTKTNLVVDQLLSLPPEGWQLLPYLSEREGKRLTRGAKVNRFYGQETHYSIELTVADDTGRKVQRTFDLRRVHILSEEERSAARKNREGRLQRAEEELAKLNKTAKNYRTAEQLTTKANKLLNSRRLAGLIEVSVEAETGMKPYGLTFKRCENALENDRRRDGLYTLLTSVSTAEMSTNDVLKTFKQQGRIEARHADLKGPLAVNPVYLKNNQRIVGLLLVLGLALLIYTLIERKAREAVQSDGGLMQGLYPEGRLSRPTSRQILNRLSTLRMVQVSICGHESWLPVTPDAIQQRLLDMLRLPDTPKPARGAPDLSKSTCGKRG